MTMQTKPLSRRFGAILALLAAGLSACGPGDEAAPGAAKDAPSAQAKAPTQGAPASAGASAPGKASADAPAKPAGPAAGGSGAGGPAAMPPPEVGVVTVQRGTAAQTEELPGRLQAVRTAQVRARVEGIVEHRVFREGSDVKAGDVLYRLDARTLESNVASARAAVAKVRADADVTRATEKRYRALLQDRGVSAQEYEQAVARARQSEADVAAAQAALTRAQIDRGYATVRAPISGRVGRTMVTEGALVGRNDATPLTTIEQLDPVWVNFSQSSTEFQQMRQQIRSGRVQAADDVPVQLLLEDGQEYSRPGRLLFQDLAVDPATGTIALRAELPNPQRELLPGQFVRVRLPLAKSADVLAVPQRAVQASPQGQIVMVVNPDGTAAPRPVKPGPLAGNDWIIEEGLNAGDRVIVEGLQKVRPGAAVNAVPWQPATPAPVAQVSKPAAPTQAAPAAAGTSK